ncbi:unnamed protein product [Owenia fusiformis]|uniref:Uncharacterized protein n=1 Tax=Owenia fusiformis TaxID=6347 RepID=A0A8J1TYN6_OWEFU|nr:unnamed protein product [Owenia fusiformis]
MLLAIFLGLLVVVLGQDLHPDDTPAQRVSVDPDDCLAFDGLLPDEDRPGGDCCHFIQCDSSMANKTGFRFACLYPLVWNREIPACDQDFNLAGACIHSTCSMSPPPRVGCESDAEIKATYGADHCCIEREDGVYQALPDISPAAYRFRYLDGEWPEDDAFNFLNCSKGDVFSSEDCCCETELAPVPECESDLYFQSPDDDCCSYHQCFPNKTGFWDVQCMGSVWNQAILNCDDPSLVPGCEDAECMEELVERECPLTLGSTQCCIGGVVYSLDTDDPFEDGSSFWVGDMENFENLAFCPVGQVFDVECCCCLGMAVFAPECDCIDFSFEEHFFEMDQLQNTSIQLGDATIEEGAGSCGANALAFDGDDVAILDFFARKSLGEEFTFSFAATGDGTILTNGGDGVAATFEVSVGGSTSVSITMYDGTGISLSGGGGEFVTITKVGDVISLYIDGSLSDSTEAKGSPDTTDYPLYIGDGYEGLFDALVFCSFGYDEAQVNALANGCNVVFQNDA